MEASKLAQVLKEAKLGAHIELTLKRFATSMLEATMAEFKADMLLHFARTGRIAILKGKAEDTVMVIAKTTVFTDADAIELAQHVHTIITAAIARDLPPHEIALEVGDNGWQLRFSGGNKFLRGIFTALHETTERLLGVPSSIILDKDGTAVIDLSHAQDSDAYMFAEATAKQFQTQLVF